MTVKYVLEKVVVLEDAKWYGENRVILVAHGIVKAGVDLQKLQPGATVKPVPWQPAGAKPGTPAAPASAAAK